MSIDPVALKTELDGDPLSLGYAGKSNGQLVGILNTIGVGAEFVVDKADVRDSISSQEIIEATVKAEFLILTLGEQMFYSAIVGRDTLVVTNSIKTQLASLFAGGTTTRANLIALATRQGSRAEVLFNQNVSLDDIRAARALP